MTDKSVSESNKIWDEIRSKPINMFALDGQIVEQHVHKLELSVGNAVYLKLVSSAVLPALEEAVGKEYIVEQAENYVIVKRAETKPVFADKKYEPTPYVRSKAPVKK